MPALRANRAVVTEVFHDLSHQITEIALAFARRYHVDREEAIAEAYYQFLRAYHSYDPTRGTSIQQRLGGILPYRLLDKLEQERRQSPVVKRVALYDYPSKAATTFHTGELRECLSADARIVMDLILDSPLELSQKIRDDSRTDSIRRHVRQWCRDHMGWSYRRYQIAIESIRREMNQETT